MTKLEKIKEYFMVNNITEMSGAYCNFPDGNKARYTYMFWVDLYDPNAFSKEFIVCLKEKNTSYLVDFLSPNPHYQKIGDYQKGYDIAEEIDLYYNSSKYVNLPKQFVSPTKQIHCEGGKENIKKYYDFWKQKLIEFPQYSEQIKSRLEPID